MTAVEAPAADEEVLEVTPEFEAAAERQERRRGFLLALPEFGYLTLFFAVPLVIVVVYSFATRNRFGGTDLSGWNVDSYVKLAEPLVREIFFRSVWLAALTTVICLVIGYPFAYYLATRSLRVRNVMLVFVMIPFWTNFLVRNYAASHPRQRRSANENYRVRRSRGARVPVHPDRGRLGARLRLPAVHDPSVVRSDRANRPAATRGES